MEEADLRRRVATAEAQRRRFLDGRYWLLRDEDVPLLPEVDGVPCLMVGAAIQQENVSERTEEEKEMLRTHLVPGVRINPGNLRAYASGDR